MKIDKKDIEIFINTNKNTYDIKKTKNARFIDQKVTPDVLSVIAESILNYTETNNTSSFTITDIRKLESSNEIVMDTFNKPNINQADNEYDKFFSQPIEMLTYSGVLSEDTVSRPYLYKIENKNILEYIS